MFALRPRGSFVADHDLDGMIGERRGFEGAPTQALVDGGGAGGPEVDAGDAVLSSESEDVSNESGGYSVAAGGRGDVEAGEPGGEMIVRREIGFIEGDGADELAIVEGEEGDGEAVSVKVLAELGGDFVAVTAIVGAPFGVEPVGERGDGGGEVREGKNLTGIGCGHRRYFRQPTLCSCGCRLRIGRLLHFAGFLRGLFEGSGTRAAAGAGSRLPMRPRSLSGRGLLKWRASPVTGWRSSSSTA